MITALLCLLESKQDNGCFLQKMKQSFDICFQLETMRGTHHSQPFPFLSFLSGLPSVLDTPRCSCSFSTPYPHFFLHLSPLLVWILLFFLSHPPFKRSAFCICPSHTCTHTYSWFSTHTVTSFQLSLAVELHSQLTCTFVMSNKLSARKRGKYGVIICTGCK